MDWRISVGVLVLALMWSSIELVAALPCPLDWQFAGNTCYMMNSSSRLSWAGAQALCQEKGAGLVSIINRSQQVDLFELLHDRADSQWWINIRETEGSSREWNRKQPLDFFGDDKVVVSAASGSQCVYISADDGMWYWASCDRTKSFICEKASNEDEFMSITYDRSLPDSAWLLNNSVAAYSEMYAHIENITFTEEKAASTRTVTPAPPASSSTSGGGTAAGSTEAPNLCRGDNWMMMGARCYKLFLDARNWSAADAFCQDQGGNLADFSSEVSQASWTSQYDYHSGSIWIGVNQREDSLWYWSTNASLNYLAWAPGQPSTRGDQDACVSLALHTGKWSAEDCSAFKPFACARSLNSTAIVTTTTPATPATTTTQSPCGSGGWLHYSGSCFMPKLNGKPLSWHAAQQQCRKIASNLAKISSYEMNTFVLGKISTSTLQVWIGLNRLRNLGTLTWLDSSQPGYSNWNSDHGLLSAVNSCVRMNHETGRWTLEDCNAPLFYVCQRPVTGSAPAPSSPSALRSPTCREGWTLVSQMKCARIFSSKKTWSKAKTECSSFGKGSDLLSIASAQEQASLILLVRNRSESLWSGLSYVKSDSHFYSWSDESVFNFTNWAPGQPTTVCDACPATCGLVTAGKARIPGVWEDVDCKHRFHYACQMPPYEDNKAIAKSRMCSGIHSKFTAIGNTCYYVKNTLDKWVDAVSYCRAHDSSLSYVRDVFDNAELLKQLAGQSYVNYWLGLSDTEMYGTMHWIAPWPEKLGFTWWADDNSKGSYHSNCAALNAVNGTWIKLDCASPQAYVCMYAPDRFRVSDSNGCPSSKWAVSKSKCFMGGLDNQDTSTWQEAKANCEREGFQLAVISSKQDQLAVREAVSRLTTGDEAWIGLRRGTLEADFEWVDDSDGYFQAWQSGLPSASGESCAVTSKYRGGRWNELTCKSYRSYICMVDKLPIPKQSSSVAAPSDGWSTFGVLCLVVAVLVVLALFVNIGVRHYFISWAGCLSAVTSGRMKMSSLGRPSVRHSIENLAYNHHDEALADNGSSNNQNQSEDAKETTRWGSQQELVSYE